MVFILCKVCRCNLDFIAGYGWCKVWVKIFYIMFVNILWIVFCRLMVFILFQVGKYILDCMGPYG